MMKKLFEISLFVLTVSACGNKFTADLEGINDVKAELDSKFGNDAHYLSINITNVETLGLTISTTVTDDPNSYKLEEWNYSNGSWNQSSEVTIELSGGEPADFMFQLDKEVSLNDMGLFIEESIEKLESDKDLDAKLSFASVEAPEDGDKSAMKYRIGLTPENGGTLFSYTKTISSGKIDFSY